MHVEKYFQLCVLDVDLVLTKKFTQVFIFLLFNEPSIEYYIIFSHSKAESLFSQQGYNKTRLKAPVVVPAVLPFRLSYFKLWKLIHPSAFRTFGLTHTRLSRSQVLFRPILGRVTPVQKGCKLEWTRNLGGVHQHGHSGCSVIIMPSVKSQSHGARGLTGAALCHGKHNRIFTQEVAFACKRETGLYLTAKYWLFYRQWCRPILIAFSVKTSMGNMVHVSLNLTSKGFT